MLATIGDLVEDVVVRLATAIERASDTEALISRRQGGSAANVAVAARRRGASARLLAQVGDDPTGRSLVAELGDLGVDVGSVRQRGTTGTIVVLVEPGGERSMLTDRRAALALDAPERAWLEGVDVLHVPYYSLAAPPLAVTATTLIGWAHEQRMAVSIDLSSTALLRAAGVDTVRRRLAELAPSVVLANESESAALELTSAVGSATTVIKRGPRPVLVFAGEHSIEVPVDPIGDVDDTTGAGDAFAAGFLTDRSPDGRLRFPTDPVAAARAGNQTAATHLTHLDPTGER